MWYDHVINECFTENMNIARVLRRLAYSFKRHVYVMDYYFVHVGMMKVHFLKEGGMEVFSR